MTSIAQSSNARRHLADRSQRPAASHKVGDDGDVSHFGTSITSAPTQEQSIPPKLASTLEQIVGQLDMLTQVKKLSVFFNVAVYHLGFVFCAQDFDFSFSKFALYM